MPRLHEPEWAETETAFARWAEDNDCDETDEAFALFEKWVEGDPEDLRDRVSDIFGQPFPDDHYIAEEEDLW